MNIIYTRDLHDRLEELRGMREEIKNKYDVLVRLNSYGPNEDEQEEHDEEVEGLEKELTDLEAGFSEDEQEELAELEAMESEIPEWRHGGTLIPERDWVEYCEELCKDVGYLPQDVPWWTGIDWDKTAANMRQDYSEIEYQGTTYLYRS